MIWVTGASGFIGRHVCSLISQYNALYLPLSKESISGYIGIDLNDREMVENLAKKTPPTHIVHLASGVRKGSIDALYKDTFLATVSLIESCARLGLKPRLVYVRSSSELNTNGVFPGHYAQAKINTANYIKQRSYELGVEAVGLILYNVVGPGQPKDFFIGRAIDELLTKENLGKTLNIEFEHLNASRDFIDVRDVARAIWLSLESGLKGCEMEICSGVESTLQKTVQLIVANFSQDVEVQVKSQINSTDYIQFQCGSTKSAKELLGFEAEFTLSQSISDMVAQARSDLKPKDTNL